MKQILLTLSFILTMLTLTAQEKKSWTVNGNIQLTNNGISIIPAFSLGEPAIMARITIQKKSLFFTQELNQGFNFKPWSSNTRLGYYFFNKGNWSASIGLSLGNYFAERKQWYNGEQFQLQRYSGQELNVFHRISDKTSLNFAVWNNAGLDNLGVKSGQFYSAGAGFSNIDLGKNFELTVRPSAFYITSSIGFNGLFASTYATLKRKNWKANVFAQATQPIEVSENQGKFIWNCGINIPF